MNSSNPILSKSVTLKSRSINLREGISKADDKNDPFSHQIPSKYLNKYISPLVVVEVVLLLLITRFLISTFFVQELEDYRFGGILLKKFLALVL
ncbi:hypothetical protein MKX03_022028, partial [Papaver bracteatum]